MISQSVVWSCWGTPGRLLPKAISASVSLFLWSCRQHENGAIWDHSETFPTLALQSAWVVRLQPQTPLWAAAQPPWAAFKMSWRRCRGRNESRSSCSGHKLWKMPFFISSYPTEASAWKLTISEHGDNISSDFCTHEIQELVWNELGIAPGDALRWNLISSKLNQKRKQSKGKLNANEIDLEEAGKDECFLMSVPQRENEGLTG